jgi:hypothetical protein
VRLTRALLLGATHAACLAAGVALGIYWLPILTAPPAPDAAVLAAASAQATFTGQFRRDLQDSDALHWGEGRVSIGPQAVALQGRLAPGPDYRLYLSPTFVETEADFLRLKPQMRELGPIRTFDGFQVAVPDGTDVAAYRAVIVWCESFGQFITAASYR